VRALLAAALAGALLACGALSNKVTSNLSIEEQARLRSFADALEERGMLRPAVPLYLPAALDRAPATFGDENAEHVVLVFYPPEDRRNIILPDPLYLWVVRNLDSQPGGSPCDGLNAAAGDECIEVNGEQARLGLLVSPESSVSYVLRMRIGDSSIIVDVQWKVAIGSPPEEMEGLRDEVIQIAESLELAPPSSPHPSESIRDSEPVHAGFISAAYTGLGDLSRCVYSWSRTSRGSPMPCPGGCRSTATRLTSPPTATRRCIGSPSPIST
jgi:hypothetical protein